MSFVFVFSCASSRSTNHITTSDGKEWELVSMEYLSNKHRNYHMYYVGSYEKYHLIYWHDKLAYRMYFAVNNDEYTPDNAYNYSTTDSTKRENQWQQVFK